ncbi:MAG: inositol monophosphatase family protein [Bacteroidia bacterium]
MNYEDLCQQVISLSGETAEYILEEKKHFNISDIRSKGFNDLVSYLDIETEKRLKERLSQILPGATFLAEETAAEAEATDLTWIIDPIDGTTNFVHGMAIYCISIALYHNGAVRMGVVYEVETSRAYYAWEGGGAWRDRETIRVSDVQTLDDSLVATGFPSRDYGRLPEYMEVFEYCMRYTHGVRRLGSAALDLVYLAEGQFDTFYEYGLSPWDVAAAALIVKEAGGEIYDFEGGGNYLFGKEIIATNGKIGDAFLKIVHKAFSKNAQAG